MILVHVYVEICFCSTIHIFNWFYFSFILYGVDEESEKADFLLIKKMQLKSFFLKEMISEILMIRLAVNEVQKSENTIKREGKGKNDKEIKKGIEKTNFTMHLDCTPTGYTAGLNKLFIHLLSPCHVSGEIHFFLIC